MAINVENISKLWPDAEFWQAAQETVPKDSSLLLIDIIVNCAFVLGVIVIFAFFYSKIIDGIKTTFSAIRKTKEMLIINADPSVRTSRTIYLLFSTSLILFVGVKNKLITFSFWHEYPSTILVYISMIIVFIGIVIFRKIYIALLDWANNSEIFVEIDRTSLFYIGAVFSIILPLVILLEFVNNSIFQIINIMIMIVVFLFILLYVVRCLQLIILNRFSLFSYFVYLCTLEFLPFIILVRIISNN